MDGYYQNDYKCSEIPCFATFTSRKLQSSVIGFKTTRGIIHRPENGFEKYLGVSINENLSFKQQNKAVDIQVLEFWEY